MINGTGVSSAHVLCDLRRDPGTGTSGQLESLVRGSLVLPLTCSTQTMNMKGMRLNLHLDAGGRSKLGWVESEMMSREGVSAWLVSATVFIQP